MSEPIDDLGHALRRLEDGIAHISAEEACALAEEWRQRVSTDERASAALSADLARLADLYRTRPDDSVAVGEALTRLGRRTLALAPLAKHDHASTIAISRLGFLLLHSGHALRGPHV